MRTTRPLHRSVTGCVRSVLAAGAGLLVAATLTGPAYAAEPDGAGVRAPAGVPTSVTFAVTGRSVEARVVGTGGSDALAGSAQLLVDGVVRDAAPVVPVADDGAGARPAATVSFTAPAGVASAATFVVRYLGSPSYESSSQSYRRTSPTLTAQVLGGHPVSRWGWHRGPVDVSFVCAAGSSAVTTCGGASRLTESGSVRGWADASDGGAGSMDVEVRIDGGAPRVWTSRRAGSGSPLACRASDATSGVASCRLTWTRYHQEGRDARTWRGWTAVATDRAGNRTTRRGTWTGR